MKQDRMTHDQSRSRCARWKANQPIFSRCFGVFEKHPRSLFSTEATAGCPSWILPYKRADKRPQPRREIRKYLKKLWIRDANKRLFTKNRLHTFVTSNLPKILKSVMFLRRKISLHFANTFSQPMRNLPRDSFARIGWTSNELWPPSQTTHEDSQNGVHLTWCFINVLRSVFLRKLYRSTVSYEPRLITWQQDLI